MLARHAGADLSVVLASADVVQGAAVLAAGAAAAWVLLAADRRRRSRAMLAALAVAGLALATVAGRAIADVAGDRPALAAAALIAGAGLIVALAAVLRRRPHLLGPFALAALPFRVPVPVGDESVNLLLPLYAVVLAGALAYAAAWWGEDAGAGDRPDRRRVRLERALAVVVALYALQALYSPDPEQAVKSLCFFYVPFAVLYVLLSALDWTPQALGRAFRVVTVLALGFAGIGLVEYATQHLIVSNPKVIASNELKPYFRVNSLFFDPNIYGRFLALAMVVLGAVLLWTRRGVHVAALGAALAVLWAGLVASLSQSSFAALLVGLAVLAALRWRPWPVVAAAAAGLAATVCVVVLAPGAIGLRTDSFRDVDRATSGRLGLVRGGLEMAGDRPLTGVGSGGFAAEYREREDIRSPRIAAVSHTTPITVAAEQGAIGLLAYGALLWAAVALVFGGARRVAAYAPPVHALARAAIAAAAAALFAHTLGYAAFLEDPLSWVLLALAAGVRAATPPEDRLRRRRRRASPQGEPRITVV